MGGRLEEACLQDVNHMGGRQRALAAHHLAQLVQGCIVRARPCGPAGQALPQPLRSLAAVLRPLQAGCWGQAGAGGVNRPWEIACTGLPVPFERACEREAC